jgi:hypothetical protein
VKVESNWGKQPFGVGWWWGVWQDDRLVGFGAGYRDKRRCFAHEVECRKRASKGSVPTVECKNPAVVRRRP